ncbi:MAG: hypothetical protein H0W66_01010 [Chthoniobacterales bacterium]|nr:hypothetical protein [Chthoniobacterales bacterium]
MIDWWSSLLLERQIFYAMGLASISILQIQIVLTFIGIDTHHDAELAHGEHESGLGFLSVRTITAFFVGSVGPKSTRSPSGTAGKTRMVKPGRRIFSPAWSALCRRSTSWRGMPGPILPTYLGKLQEAAQGQSSRPTRAEMTEKEAPPPAKA